MSLLQIAALMTAGVVNAESSEGLRGVNLVLEPDLCT